MRASLKLGIVVVCVVLVGCASPSKSSISSIEAEVFEVGSRQGLGDSTGNKHDELYIIKHNESGKEFILYKGFRKGGITPLD